MKENHLKKKQNLLNIYEISDFLQEIRTILFYFTKHKDRTIDKE